MGTATLTVRPLQPTIGAEIDEIDLRGPIGDDTRDEIKNLLLEHKVLFFRDQEIDRKQQAAFAARFGPLYIHPMSKGADDAPAVHRVTAEDYKLPGRSLRASGHATSGTDGSSGTGAAVLARHGGRPTWDGYHTDTSWRLVPTWGAVLRSVVLPSVGGDTIWVDANLAYESLEADLKKLGMDRAESNELLTLISDAYRKPEHQVRFSWRPGSVVLWDNRATVHYGVNNYNNQPRLLERVLIADEPLYADL